MSQFRCFEALALVALAAVAFAQDKPAAPDVAAKPGKTFTIGMSQCNLGEPWRVQMNADVKKAAEAHPELKVTYKDAQNDTLRQRAQVEEFVSAGVDLIIISPKEAMPLTQPVAAAMKKGIPVIVLDRRVVGNDFTCFIGADNKKIGKAAGEYIVKMLGGKGNVVELKGLMTSTPGQDRNSGFREGIKGSDLKIVFEADMKWLEPDARKEMASALARFDKIDLVYAHNDPGAHGAYLAAQAAGAREGHQVCRDRRPPAGGPSLCETGHPRRKLRVSHRRHGSHRAGHRNPQRQAGAKGNHALVARVHEREHRQGRRGAGAVACAAQPCDRRTGESALPLEQQPVASPAMLSV